MNEMQWPCICTKRCIHTTILWSAKFYKLTILIPTFFIWFCQGLLLNWNIEVFLSITNMFWYVLPNKIDFKSLSFGYKICSGFGDMEPWKLKVWNVLGKMFKFKKVYCSGLVITRLDSIQFADCYVYLCNVFLFLS